MLFFTASTVCCFYTFLAFISGYDYEEDELDIFNGEPNDASFNVELAKAALRGMRGICVFSSLYFLSG